MNTKILGFLAAALFAGPMAANAQAVVYDFTGIVTSSEIDTYAGPVEPFPSVPIGTQVSGMYTLDLANSNGGGPGTGNWFVTGGSSLFSSTIRAGQVVYATSPAFAQSFVEGLFPEGNPIPTFEAGELFANHTGVGASSFSIVNPHGAWSAGGLPIFAGATLAAGTVEFSVPADSGNALFFFNITSLVRAPELDAASAVGGLTLLLSGLAMAVGARRSREPEARRPRSLSPMLRV